MTQGSLECRAESQDNIGLCSGHVSLLRKLLSSRANRGGGPDRYRKISLEYVTQFYMSVNILSVN